MSHLASTRTALETLAKDSVSELVRAVATKSLSELDIEASTQGAKVTAVSNKAITQSGNKAILTTQQGNSK
jgi:hypothetical protein